MNSGDATLRNNHMDVTPDPTHSDHRTPSGFGRHLATFGSYCTHNLNFYRIHLLTFCIVPTLMAAVLYASNGAYPVSYGMSATSVRVSSLVMCIKGTQLAIEYNVVDALFNSVSAATVTGLTTVNISELTGWQQTILYLQMWLGNIVSLAGVPANDPVPGSLMLMLFPKSGLCILDHGHCPKIIL
jgi:hypothetical protein